MMFILRRDLFTQIGRLTAAVSISQLGTFDEVLNPDAWERLLATLSKSVCIDEEALLHSWA